MYDGLRWVALDFFFFKQKTAYEMRISDWSSDVCSSDRAEMKALEAEQEAIDAEEGADESNERWDAICRREQEIEDALEGIETGREEPDTDIDRKSVV